MLRSLLLAAAALLPVPLVAAPTQVPSRLEAYLSYPFASLLVSAPGGNQIAWVETRKGVRTIWTADAPVFSAHRLFTTGQDDGQEFSSLTYSPDGRILAWVRGGGEGNPWADGHAPPNPGSSVEQPQEEIWVSIAGGEPMKAAQGLAPTISAAGHLAYLKDDQVWSIDLNRRGKPEKLFYDRGRDSGLAWSPDGTRLAFVSRRADHSFIGVYSGGANPVTWMMPTTAFDTDPIWSPDGRRIAFARQEGLPDALISPLVERPNPFSIWVADAIDGTASPAWKSPNDLSGSLPDLSDGLFLKWGAGDRLIFRAEMDGWPHLYSVPVTGGTATLLTPGNFMVEQVEMAADRKTLLFSANSGSEAGDIDRRHLFKVGVDRPAPIQLTSGAGLEWTPVPIGRGLAYIASTATTPMQVVVANGDRTQSVGSASPDYAANDLVTPKPITFTAADGLSIHGQLFLPPGGSRHPALIFVHGGPARQMLLGWSYMDYYTHAYALNQYLVSRGFAVLSVNYRMGVGYGRAFQHAPSAGPAGNAEYQDVVAGARFLQARPDVDAARIGIWGGSYGGLLTAHALAHDSAIFKAGVDLHGVHDWSLMPGEGRPRRYEQGDYDAALKSAFESSPESAISSWKSPVLLIHGDDDRNVPFEQTVDLARRLRAQGVPFEELILPNEVHGFLRYGSWLKADTALVSFLEDKLKQAKN